MAEEGTLGLARAHDSVDDVSKEDLQRRMDEARESISQTVTEIKDTVVHQYESVKESISETLDWREQFKKRPAAWAAGAVGAGFLTGYCLTAMVKGDGNGHDRYYQEDYQPTHRAYAAQPIVGQSAFPGGEQDEDKGPGLIEKIQDTQIYDRVKNEAAAIGGHLVDEVSKTAKDILVPAAVSLVRNWLEGLLPKTATAGHK
jgi:hypothetical protein